MSNKKFSIDRILGRQRTPAERLSSIETQWSLVQAAHGESSRDVLVRGKLVDSYGPAVRKYLRASLQDEDAADELFQEFVLKLMRGDFRYADSDKGRFRSMIKTSLYHLIVDYHRRRTRKTGMLIEDQVVDPHSGPEEDHFQSAWRNTLLEQVWNRLEQLQQQTGRPYYTTLRCRADHPDWTNPQLREALEHDQVAFPTESAMRVFLHRCRKRFAVLLLDQVAQSLQNLSQEALEDELIALGLHRYCKFAIE